MPGLPQYPDDWASKFADIERRLNDLASAAQTRVGFTGGTLTDALTVQGILTAAGGLAVTGDVTASGDLIAVDDLDVSGDAVIDGTLSVGGVGLATFLNPPYGIATKGGAQSINNTTTTGITGCTYTATAAGYHHITGALLWDLNATGRRETGIRIQGGATWLCDSRHSSSNTSLIAPVAALIPMNAGQTVELIGWQNTGGGLNVLAGSRIEAIWRRPL